MQSQGGLSSLRRDHHTGRIIWPMWIKDALCEAQNHRCCYCGVRMGATGNRRDYPTIEHVTKLSDGGADALDNIVIACRGCNEDRA